MLPLEFVESKEEQALKRYCDEGKAASLRLAEPEHIRKF
jgi:hypothetical protein